MKGIFTILFFFLITAGSSQVVFKLIVPPEPVIAGESFRVQFVAEGIETIDQLTVPSFSGFKIINSPEVYSRTIPGKGVTRNTIYTLETISPGMYRIPGALAIINGKRFRSNDGFVEVISREQAEQLRRENGAFNDATYFLQPGEDPYQKMRKNLFIKVLLSKKICYSGEPVVATFKLYSRLQSRSEISKSPGFYGFTVYDMVNLENKEMSTEMVDGKLFDVHTIRKVQLYPLQAGSFIIDPMEVNNKVEFSRSFVTKKAEQEIVEGAAAEEKMKTKSGTEVYENTIRTEPVAVIVKPIPSKNKPADFNGATGRFSIEATLDKNELARNEEGHLLVTIRGKGNFTQLSAPVIQWPTGIEGFDPAIHENLDKQAVPLSGSKTFRYSFVSSKAGKYDLPTIKFSFFDPDTNNYKTISASIRPVSISNLEKTNPSSQGVKKRSIADVNRKASIVAAIIVAALVLIVLLYWGLRNKEIPLTKETETAAKKVTIPPVDDLLEPVRQQLSGTDKEFYSKLYQSIWIYLAQFYQLSGTELNKRTVIVKLQENNFMETEELMNLLQRCETGMFTQVSLEENKEELLQRAKQLLEKIPT